MRYIKSFNESNDGDIYDTLEDCLQWIFDKYRIPKSKNDFDWEQNSPSSNSWNRFDKAIWFFSKFGGITFGNLPEKLYLGILDDINSSINSIRKRTGVNFYVFNGSNSDHTYWVSLRNNNIFEKNLL